VTDAPWVFDDQSVAEYNCNKAVSALGHLLCGSRDVSPQEKRLCQRFEVVQSTDLNKQTSRAIGRAFMKGSIRTWLAVGYHPPGLECTC
jgi:hypothetical protein